MFAIAVFAFVAISAVVSDSVLKGLAALLIGLVIAVIGTDQITGATRFTYEQLALFDGIDIVVVTVALLAIGEVISVASKVGRPDDRSLIPSKGRPFLTGAEFREALPAWLRGTAFGLPFGVIPAGGAEVPTFLSYGTERRLDRRRRKPMFGKGAIRGVAGPEAAGNATSGTAMGSLLALGLPTSATAALILAALVQWGFQPGPLLFTNSPDLVWALIASLFLGLVVLLVLNLPFAPLWAQLLRIPKAYLYAAITMLACFGVYATSASTIDLAIMLGLGFLAFLMRRFDVPIAPVVIAVILGPLAEQSLRQAMNNTGDDISVLVSSPITVILYVVLVLGVVGVVIGRIRSRRRSDY